MSALRNTHHELWRLAMVRARVWLLGSTPGTARSPLGTHDAGLG